MSTTVIVLAVIVGMVGLWQLAAPLIQAADGEPF